MKGRGNAAIVQKRNVPSGGLDDYPTPPAVTRAFLEHVLPQGSASSREAWEPAANRGYMARTLEERFAKVHASDIADYGMGYPQQDFLASREAPGSTTWIVTNPPFNQAEEFIHHSLSLGMNCAFLLRQAFIEGKGRYSRLFLPKPPSIYAPFVERTYLYQGEVSASKKGGTQIYAWFVWLREWRSETIVRWIPPCLRQLARPEDYNAMGKPGERLDLFSSSHRRQENQHVNP